MTSAAQFAWDRFENDFRVGGNGLKYLFEAGIDGAEASIHGREARVDFGFEAVDLAVDPADLRLQPVDLGFNPRQAILHLDLLAFLTQLIRTDLPQVRLHLLHFSLRETGDRRCPKPSLLSLSQIQH